MRTLEITAYTFDELSETAKLAALNNNIDINTNHDWWQYVYEDAENFGIDITSFDIYRCNITIKLTYDPLEVANTILNECGTTSVLYSIGEEYITGYNKLVVTGNDTDEKLEELASEFKGSIRKHYLYILISEYQYLESNEAIIESLMANMYEFTEDGNNLKY
jgi:hypothetical protein